MLNASYYSYTITAITKQDSINKLSSQHTTARDYHERLQLIDLTLLIEQLSHF